MASERLRTPFSSFSVDGTLIPAPFAKFARFASTVIGVSFFYLIMGFTGHDSVIS